MSRIGNKPVPLADGAKVSISGRTIEVEGPKGKLSYEHRPEVIVSVNEDDKQLVVTRDNDERASREFHGLTRALLANMVEGVTKGYEKRLEIVGVGLPGGDPGRHAAVAGRIRQRAASKDPQRFDGHLPGPDAHRGSRLRQAKSRPVCRRSSLVAKTRALQGQGGSLSG